MMNVIDDLRATDPPTLVKAPSTSSISNLSEDGLSDLNDDEYPISSDQIVVSNNNGDDKSFSTSVTESRDLVCFARVIKYM